MLRLRIARRRNRGSRAEEKLGLKSFEIRSANIYRVAAKFIASRGRRQDRGQAATWIPLNFIVPLTEILALSGKLTRRFRRRGIRGTLAAASDSGVAATLVHSTATLHCFGAKQATSRRGRANDNQGTNNFAPLISAVSKTDLASKHNANSAWIDRKDRGQSESDTGLLAGLLRVQLYEILQNFPRSRELGRIVYGRNGGVSGSIRKTKKSPRRSRVAIEEIIVEKVPRYRGFEIEKVAGPTDTREPP